MKRKGKLIGKIAEIENLHLAFCKAARGKRTRLEVRSFQNNLHEELHAIRKGLVRGDIHFGDYRFFTVYEPKKREICAATFRERVIHHAIMNIVEPVFERYAIVDSYACRKKKGMHAAVKKAKKLSNRYRYYLQLDIAKYFDSIDHDVVVTLIRRLIKDRAVLLLFENIVKSYSTVPGKGMPIGNLISQHVANLYLGFFDHWVKEVLRVKGYVRYMDDFILFGNDKQEIKMWLQQVKEELASSLQLRLHKRRQLNQCKYGISYLGYRVYPDGIRLGKRSRSRFIRKFKQFEQNFLNGDWDMATLNRHMCGLIGFTTGADSVGFRRGVIRHSRVLSEEKKAITG